MKTLKDLTLEELWQLFPISLSPHNPLWNLWAKQEIYFLYRLLSEVNPAINHIGSTAIPRLKAKPIIDILVEVAEDVEWHKIKDLMDKRNYICMSESEARVSFNKGYTTSGYETKVFHIHFHRNGDNDEIIFRNYLIEHPEIAEKYEMLKNSLLPEYKNNRDCYTEAKSYFVRDVLRKAKMPL